MKAVLYHEYGPADVLKLHEIAKPTPQANQVLIKVHASSVNAGDVNMRGFTFVPPGFGFLPRLMFGLKRPKKNALGIEVAGVVEAVGSAVTRFRPGDQVFGMCSELPGTYAEYVCWPETAPLVVKPANLTYAEVVSVPFGALTALYFLRDLAKVQPGQKVLVNGASGGVGIYAVQLARHFGAQVTGVCSAKNAALVLSCGAGTVIDYTRQDFTQNGETYDVIVDTVVGKNDFERCKNSLTPQGLYLAVAGGPREMGQMLWTSMTGGKKVLAGQSNERVENLTFLAELLQNGSMKPVVDRSYPLSQTAEAHRYVDTGRKRGGVVIIVNES